MEKKYYIVGLRPVIREEFSDMDIFYAMEWETGEFKINNRYYHEVLDDPSGVSKSDFDQYITKKRVEKKLTTNNLLAEKEASCLFFT